MTEERVRRRTRRTAPGVGQSPWRTLRNRYLPVEIMSADEVETIHRASLRILDEIGYHCKDYFVAQWDRFKQYPGGILAHSTHVKGLGTFDVATGVETSRVEVTLATGIPRERCERVNLGYRDPATVDPERIQDEWGDRSLVVPRAGEMLYRVGSPPAV